MINDPIQLLEDEHRFIAKVVSAASVLADRLDADQPVKLETLESIVEFMRTYADKCHHGKEEELLFPKLAERGVPLRGCPIDALTREHALGRALVKGLAEATGALRRGDPSAQESLIKNLRGIAELYPQHIWKEDYLLFPMSNKVLTADDQHHLAQEFEKVEDSVGRDVHQRLQQLSEELAQLN